MTRVGTCSWTQKTGRTTEGACCVAPDKTGETTEGIGKDGNLWTGEHGDPPKEA